jgi:histidyl-tRNA synthetase
VTFSHFFISTKTFVFSFKGIFSDFEIRINSRKLLNDLFKKFSLTDEQSQIVSKIIHKKNKISNEIFEAGMEEIIGDKAGEITRILSKASRLVDIMGKENANTNELIKLIEKLQSLGIKNVVFDPTLTRGFDYYTEMVFEVFDTAPENNRSVFGGGRYDDLLDIFGSRKVPAVGFGAGDVTTRDFLETHKLLPIYSPSAKLYIAVLESKYIENALNLAKVLRTEDINVMVDLTEKKVGDQIRVADKQKIPFTVAIGENEAKSDLYVLKNMETGSEIKLSIAEIVAHLKNSF